jgi:acetyl esterase/lipase
LPAEPSSIFDTELFAALPKVLNTLPAAITPQMISGIRTLPLNKPVDEVLARCDRVRHSELVADIDNGPQVPLSVFWPRDQSENAPLVYYVHGGGTIFGDRFDGADLLARWVQDLGVVGISVEYRLAPEHKFPLPHDDCYNGAEWIVANADELHIDVNRIVIAGTSAGGGLAASTALRARDNGRDIFAGQLLMCPMLDDRTESISHRQFAEVGTWTRASHETAWNAVLGDRKDKAGVSTLAAPGRENDLSKLPPAFVDVGSTEMFRDEALDYARRIWETGGDAEVHVWGGAYHGFDSFVPRSKIAKAARDARTNWLRRVLRLP